MTIKPKPAPAFFSVIGIDVAGAAKAMAAKAQEIVLRNTARCRRPWPRRFWPARAVWAMSAARAWRCVFFTHPPRRSNYLPLADFLTSIQNTNMPPFDKARYQIEKMARRATKTHPLATIAFYGPDDKRATKVVVGIISKPNASADHLENDSLQTRGKICGCRHQQMCGFWRCLSGTRFNLSQCTTG